jgi:hypothetical protein
MQLAVTAAAFTCHAVALDQDCRRFIHRRQDRSMKRSRRVVLTLMGSAAVGAVSMGLTPRRDCGPGMEAVPGLDGRPYCRARSGFGYTSHRIHGHGHGGHGHGGHGHGGG